MQFIKTEFEGLVEIQPRIFRDERGYFLESYRKDRFLDAGIDVNFVQDNVSQSSKGVIRGLHLQHAPHAQAKLVRAIKGRILDVCLDLRPDSPTFGKVYCAELDSERNNMIFVPEGFAHGFSALEDAMIHYKTNNFYHKDSESGVLWNDPQLNIDWKVENPVISDKDAQLPSFESFTSQFL